jgi:hypothetical protein
MGELALKARGGGLISEGIEHFRGGEETDGGSGEDGLVGEIAGDERLADAVGSDEDDIGHRVEPVEAEKVFDLGAVDFLGPAPVEISQGFEGADACAPCAAFKASADALLLFPGEQLRQPGLVPGLVPVGEKPVKLEVCGLLAQVVHSSSSWGSSRS